MILISISSASQLVMFKSLCERIKKQYDNIVFVAFDCNEKQVETIRNAANKLGLQFEAQSIRLNKSIIINSTNKSISQISVFDKLHELMKPWSYKKMTRNIKINKKKFANHIKSNLAGAQYLIEKYKPQLVLVGEDGVSGNNFLIKQANQNNIPVLNIPYEMSGREDFVNLINEKIEDESVIKFNPQDSRYHKFLKKQFKHWILTTENFDTLLFPLELIIARLEYGLDLLDPWTTHGGNANLIAVESAAMFTHYLKENLSESKLKLVGSVYCDVLYDSLHSHPIYKTAYLNKTKINPNITSILISLPPSYHNTRKNKNEFPSYHDMISNLFKIMNELSNTNVTVSVHPATPLDELKLIKSFNVNVSTDWVIDLIPKNDIFFVLSYSSSIRWAIACGKPIINYDAYEHNLKAYDDVDGFFNYKSLKDAQQKLKILLKKEEYEEIANQMASIRDNWGYLDGQNTNMICNLFDTLINRKMTKSNSCFN